MDEILTLTEIEGRFPGQWVLVEAPQTDQALTVQKGRVLYHGFDRDDVYRRAIALRPSRFAVLYTGSMPSDTAIVL